MMESSLPVLVWSLVLLMAIGIQHSQAFWRSKSKIRSVVFTSPVFTLGPGSATERYYYNIDFPRGHIALKSFSGEVVDQDGNSVPLHETYMHHWAIVRYHQRKGLENPELSSDIRLNNSDYTLVRNTGICQNDVLGQYFGLGSETRKTSTYIQDPYGLEIGNEVPDGYEERWFLNVHAIDTRGVEDKLGCTECWCDLYNITADVHGQPLGPEYGGGLRCCYENTRCKVKHGFKGIRRDLYFRYTIKWVEWDTSVIPVQLYLFDVTDNGKRSRDFSQGCQVEYNVESCSANVTEQSVCIDAKRINVTVPKGGYVIYAAAHQHTAGAGATLYGMDGRVICTSLPTYGQGEEAGNERGHVVGMSNCSPKPGSVKIADGEILVFESNYSSMTKHTGVMGIFHIMIATSTPEQHLLSAFPVEMQGHINSNSLVWGGLSLTGIAITVVVIMQSRFKRDQEFCYQPIGA